MKQAIKQFDPARRGESGKVAILELNDSTMTSLFVYGLSLWGSRAIHCCNTVTLSSIQIASTQGYNE